ncbi:MAG: M18 family aminopeptidase [Clostridia bacterium]|nr:M18 family aminopeptidase [Clostridia bacterium]
MDATVQEFLNFNQSAPTAWHAVEALREMLQAQSYTLLREEEPWTLQPGGRYAVLRNGSSLIAFTLPRERPHAALIAAAHSDSPSFRIKPNAMQPGPNGAVRLSVEPYGGAVFSSWADRPLAVAGRLMLRQGRELVLRNVCTQGPVCVIPGLAIHMNRELNSGYAWKPNIDLQPLWAVGEAPDLLTLLAETAGVRREDIVSHDLQLVSLVPACVWGPEEAFLSGPRLDDLECAYAVVRGLTEAGESGSLALACVFDNEEVGSGTRQGADGSFLEDTLTRILDALAFSREDTLRLLSGSLMLSADNAHAVHPNHPEYADPAHSAQMNAGVVIKHNAAQRYVTEAVSEGLFAEICRGAEVPVQHYCNRADMPGGSTLGHIALRHVSVPAVDIGLAQLAMHSSWETAGARDLPLMVRALRAFYAADPRRTVDGGWQLWS